MRTFKSNSIVTVSIKNILYNYDKIYSYVKKPIMAVLKANAYGLGLKRISYALYLHGINMFAVAYYKEAIEIISQVKRFNTREIITILVLSEFIDKEKSQQASKYNVNLICSIYNMKDLEYVCKNYDKNYKYALYFDTGFTRLGIFHHLVQDVRKKISQSDISEPKIIVSHFANTNNNCDKSQKHTKIQYLRFKQISKLFTKSQLSISGSNSIFLEKKYHMDFIKCGKALYGLIKSKKPKLKNCFSLYAKVLQVQKISKNNSIGYEQTFISKKAMKIAVISAGYADGVSSLLSFDNTTKENQKKYSHQCSIKNYKAKIIGKVSMDLTTIDVTHIPDSFLRKNQIVEIFGDNTESLIDIARMIDSNVYEFLLDFANRTKIKYLK